jgi:hypothetical protein
MHIKNAEGSTKQWRFVDIAGTLEHHELSRLSQPGLLRREKGDQVIGCAKVLNLLDLDLLV